MSDLPFQGFDIASGPDPVYISVRKMRWFRASFISVVGAISKNIGVTFEIDDMALARCFVAWLRKVERHRFESDQIRRSFFDHAAGMMLREMIQERPARIATPSAVSETTDPAHFWPEGYCYTIYCMNIRAVALQQEYGETPSISPEFYDLRTWWSFRENTTRNGAIAIAFFKLFTGGKPDWQLPDRFT